MHLDLVTLVVEEHDPSIAFSVADGPHQATAVGSSRSAADRAHGRVTLFRDIAGNRWDLLRPT